MKPDHVGGIAVELEAFPTITTPGSLHVSTTSNFKRPVGCVLTLDGIVAWSPYRSNTAQISVVRVSDSD